MLDTEIAAADLVSWAKVIDHTRCIGCHACTTACKSENEVPLSVTRTYVKYVDTGTFPRTRRAFQVTRCNQCEHAPCVTACPTAAMYRRPDGIVDFDKSICIGCKACIAACPYDAIFINPNDHSAEKCNMCAHRIDSGLEPACVVVCPTEAIIVGDLNDPDSKVARIVYQDAVNVRRPEKETHPKLFYKGAHEATLDPLAARRAEGGLYLWSQERSGPGKVPAGHPEGTSAAAAIVSYDVTHRMPWDWRVSAYTWTKGIATGIYMVVAGLCLTGIMPWGAPVPMYVTPIVALFFLAVTGGLLIADLEHPRRFHYIFLRPQWRSWLVRGGFILGGFGVALTAHLIAALLGRADIVRAIALLFGVPLALMTAIYTAWLFAQSKARDLWQNPLSPVQFAVQAWLAGAAILTVVDLIHGVAVGGPTQRSALMTELQLVAGFAALHLLLILAEMTLTHTTAHARLAAREMTRGRFAKWFRAGLFLCGIGLFAPWLGTWTVLPVLLGVLAHEHAYVQAGQAVPLA